MKAAPFSTLVTSSPGQRELSAWHEECGVVGISGTPAAAQLTYLALYALQHRGQEGCGIATRDDTGSTAQFRLRRSFGLVNDAFDQETLKKLPGSMAIGHVRYSTHGGQSLQNLQPLHSKTGFGELSVAHNGNITNADRIRKELEAIGSIFQGTSDTEVLIHMLARSQAGSIVDRLQEVLPNVQGAYSLVAIIDDSLYAVRDRFGFRPLVLGRGHDDAYVVASETCALDLIDATFIREVEPGEIVRIRDGRVDSFRFAEARRTAFCVFEPIYFARPDSLIFGETTYQTRRRMGEVLAMEAPAPRADFVIAVPDSGVPMAMGFAAKAGIPLELGLVRNHYVGRTFIQPEQEIRDFGVKLKLNPVASALKGKSVVVVDDSVVRGTTSRKIMRMLRQAQVREIHFRIGSPPITHACYYGVNTPDRDRLLAAQKNIEEIRELFDCDSIAYLSVDGLRSAVGDETGRRFCTACFHGDYPEDICTAIPVQPTDHGGPGLQAASQPRG